VWSALHAVRRIPDGFILRNGTLFILHGSFAGTCDEFSEEMLSRKKKVLTGITSTLSKIVIVLDGTFLFTVSFGAKDKPVFSRIKINSVTDQKFQGIWGIGEDLVLKHGKLSSTMLQAGLDLDCQSELQARYDAGMLSGLGKDAQEKNDEKSSLQPLVHAVSMLLSEPTVLSGCFTSLSSDDPNLHEPGVDLDESVVALRVALSVIVSDPERVNGKPIRDLLGIGVLDLITSDLPQVSHSPEHARVFYLLLSTPLALISDRHLGSILLALNEVPEMRLQVVFWLCKHTSTDLLTDFVIDPAQKICSKALKSSNRDTGELVAGAIGILSELQLLLPQDGKLSQDLISLVCFLTANSIFQCSTD